jgi:peptide/nickel transport system permease protein
VLGLLLAWLFAVVLRDTPLALPPSGRLTSGLDLQTIPEAWGLTGLQGPFRAILDFVSNMYVFCALLTGQWAAFVDAIKHMILPMVALGTIPLAIIARMTRSSLLDVMGLDYIRTARAKGLGERLVVMRHGLRNALLPVVTIIGLQTGALLAGAVLTEKVYNWGGLGTLITDSISGGRDYPVLQALILLAAFVFIVVNLVVDLSYAIIDPRVRVR